jgi:hypothetical protein
MDSEVSPNLSLRPSLPFALVRVAVAFVLAVFTGWACHDDDADEQAGQSCAVSDDCYPDVDDPTSLRGEVTCLDRVPGGYCTHLCETDEDCCAVEGECRSGYPQVCAPFESTGMRMCFLSCEAEDVGDLDDNEYCHEYANAGLSCRSTGGGSENRKVCAG